MIRLFLSIIFVGTLSIAFGQIRVVVGFEKDTIVIGDHVNFILSIESDSDVEILAIPTFFKDSIYSALQSVKAHVDTGSVVDPVLADFELISTNGWNDTNNDGLFLSNEMQWEETVVGGKILREHRFEVKLWDPGNNFVIYPPVVYSKNGVQDQEISEDQAVVFVAPPGGLPAVQDSIDIAPIKNIKEEPANLSDFIFYIILIGLAILLGFIYWLYIRYTKKKEERKLVVKEPDIFVPAHEVALEKLTDLRDRELWQKGEIKQYQSELTHIIREYLEGRYEIAALESTTDEIVRDLMKELVDQGDIVSIKRILQVADLVKFAKAIPEKNIHESFMNDAESLVERTADESKTVILNKDDE